MLYLVRHGRTEANARGLLQGRLDPPLDDAGRAQAAALADRVGSVDRVISSSLARARETAGYFSTRDGSPAQIDDRWIEIAYGDYEGTPVHQVPTAVWERWASEPDFVIEGGESFGALDQRVREACAELVPAAAETDIVVVSHVSPIKSAVAWTLGATLDLMFRCHLSQASVCRVGVGRFGPVLHSFNETVDD